MDEKIGELMDKIFIDGSNSGIIIKEAILYGRASALDEAEKELHSQQITYRFSPPYTEADFKREGIAESIHNQALNGALQGISLIRSETGG